MRMKDIVVSCRVCGEMIEHCSCEPCEVCGQTGQPVCVDHHNYKPASLTYTSPNLDEVQFRTSKGARNAFAT